MGADVEAARRVEAEHLVHQHVRQLMVEDLRVFRSREVAVLLAGALVRRHDAVDQLTKARLTLRGPDRTAEVLRRDDVGRVDGPEVGELDATLLEVDRAIAPVGHDDVATLPGDGVVRVHAWGLVDALDPQALATLARRPTGVARRGLAPDRLCHWDLFPARHYMHWKAAER